ncbi:MAG: hypothetical protein AAFU85_26390 [Planctomycetota bacterium]
MSDRDSLPGEFDFRAPLEAVRVELVGRIGEYLSHVCVVVAKHEVERGF